MASALERQRARRRQMDVEAFHSRVTIQPPLRLPGLLYPAKLCRRHPAFPGPSCIPPAPYVPVAAFRLVDELGKSGRGLRPLLKL